MGGITLNVQSEAIDANGVTVCTFGGCNTEQVTRQPHTLPVCKVQADSATYHRHTHTHTSTGTHIRRRVKFWAKSTEKE